MAFNKRIFIMELKRRKEGLIIGAVTGAIAAYYAISQGIANTDQLINAGKGLLDTIMGRSAAPVEIAKYKIYTVFITLGAFVGLIVDMVMGRFAGQRIVRKRSKRRRRK